MEKLVTVTLRNGKQVPVLRSEVKGMEEAGVLAKDYKPEPDAVTKDASAELNEGGKKWKDGEKAPVSISSKNIKGGRPKKA